MSKKQGNRRQRNCSSSFALKYFFRQKREDRSSHMAFSSSDTDGTAMLFMPETRHMAKITAAEISCEGIPPFRSEPQAKTRRPFKKQRSAQNQDKKYTETAVDHITRTCSKTFELLKIKSRKGLFTLISFLSVCLDRGLFGRGGDF